jgi:iron complex transport system permease protein
VTIFKTTEFYRITQKRKLLILSTQFLLLLIIIIIACGIGTVAIPPTDVLSAFGHAIFPGFIDAPPISNAGFIVIGYRFPRIMLAVLAGMSLAMAGAVMQGILRNPLVSPFTLGLSSAASFGAAFMIVFGPIFFNAAFTATGTVAGINFSFGTTLLILSAFFFGWMSVVLVYLVSHTKQTSQAIMILAGVIIGYLFQAGLFALQYVSDDKALRDIVTWLMGGMWGASWQAVIILLPIVLTCFFLIERRAWDLNTLSGGDDVAKNLGINVPQFRLRCLAIISFATSSCLAFTGMIGFIGLIAPHICRMVVGNDFRYLLPCSAVMGALILLVSDTAARSLFSPVEIPVGIIMYILGSLFFLYLITRGHGRYLE